MLGHFWRPIETAPKDGTKIILWANEGAVTAFWAWNEIWQGTWGEEKWIQDGSIFDDPLIAHEPTHWMPLPEQPR